MTNERPWIGVDLDGTLAEYHGWSENIGKPVPLMMERIYKWLHEGTRVKIFTARAAHPEMVQAVKDWLRKVGLPDLEVTNQKDMMMTQLWDDRCIQVIANTGIAVRIQGLA